MATGIFAIQSDGQLIEMTEAPYVSEDIFQTLLVRTITVSCLCDCASV
jgi:hypothetical protein